MSKIKTYAVNCNDAWLNTDGDDISCSYVKYADYIALATKLDLAERACAALASESAVLKKALTTIANSEEFHGDMVVCDFETLVTTAWSALNETTATDAFLSEVEHDTTNKQFESLSNHKHHFINGTCVECLKSE